MTNPLVFFHFENDNNINAWNIVNDVVMGGRSTADFSLDQNGHAVFTGEVSLDNYGGFASVRHRFPEKEIKGLTQAVIRLKGDGKRYQFRVKAGSYDRHSYIIYFETTGDWQTVTIPLKELYPTFRGRQLNMPDYAAEQLSEIAFLIGNKKEETFRLELKEIRFE